ncbi:MAG: ABC transporter permease [Candidatus Riflebacteria bacterium]|nr:ABC transporter permease [Candidatus Riflebacteria bacterium]
MLWLKFAWRNLWRNSLRTCIQLFAIAGGIFLTTFLANLQKGSWEKVVYDGVRSGSGHVGIYHEKYLTERKTEHVFQVEELLKFLSSRESNNFVEAYFPRLYVPGLARSSHESRSALILGLDIEKELLSNPILDAKRLVSGELPLKNKKEMACIGAKLAMSLQVNVGNKIVIMFQDSTNNIVSKLFRISGIFRSNVSQFDNSFVLVDRESLAEAYGAPGTAHELALVSRTHTDEKPLLKYISSGTVIPSAARAFPWQEAMPQLHSAIKMDHFQLMLFLIIVYSVIGIGAINTLLMSVMERTREFGLLRALGLNSENIRKVIIFEAMWLAFAGVGTGLFFSFFASLYTWYFGIDFTFLLGNLEVAGILIDPVIHGGWDFGTLIVMSSIMIVLVLSGSLYPAHRALKIKPAEAMRKF